MPWEKQFDPDRALQKAIEIFWAGGYDAEVAAVVAEALTGMVGFFAGMIEEGRRAGEIPSTVRPAETASALLGLFVGLRLLARSRPEPPLLRAVADQAAAMLG